MQRNKVHQRTKTTIFQNQNFTRLNLSCTGLFQLNTAVLQWNLSQQDLRFSLGLIIQVSTAIWLSKHYFNPAKFFKFKFLPLVKITQRSFTLYCLIDIYCWYGWFFGVKSLKNKAWNLALKKQNQTYRPKLCDFVHHTKF